MNRFCWRLGALIVAGACVLSQSALAYVIPINSRHENSMSNIPLFIESEMKRWKQEGLKYKEMLYTDTLGRVGGGSLGFSQLIFNLWDASKDGAAVLSATPMTLEKAPNLAEYGQVRKYLDKYYVIKPRKGLTYTTSQVEAIRENQRVAINDLATKGIAMSAVQTVWTSRNAGDSDPEKRAEDLAQAKDVNAMYELMLGLVRDSYERSLRISSVEATDAGIRAMQTLQGLARTADKQYSEEKGEI